MKQPNNDQAKISRVLDRLERKDEIFRMRMNVLTAQSAILRKLARTALDAGQPYSEGYGYGSGLIHAMINFLTSVKLYPTNVDFKHEQTRADSEQHTVATNVSEVHYLARKKGEWLNATTEATPDLIRGESFIRRYIKKDQKTGDAIGMAYEAVPFDEIRWKYNGDTDVMRVATLTRGEVIKKFGKKVADKVRPGVIFSQQEFEGYSSNRTIQSKKEQLELWSYIHYVDEGDGVEYEILASELITDKEGDKFDYTYDGQDFNPYSRRVFFQSVEERNFGYGIIDLCLPLARLDTTHGISMIKRSISDADPLTVASSNDPKEMERSFMNHMANMQSGKPANIWFQKNSGIQDNLNFQQVSTGSDASLFEFTENFIIDRAAMLTNINLRGVVDFAPTAQQDDQRQEIQDKVSIGVLSRNLSADIKFAKEDLYTLLNTDSRFHGKAVYMKENEDKYSQEEQLLLGEGGDISTADPVVIREFLNTITDLDFDLTPRVEGVLDDQTSSQIKVKRDNLNIYPIGTTAYNKAASNFSNETDPALKITEDDFSTQVEQQVAPQ